MKLNRTDSPITGRERVKINENWVMIQDYLNNIIGKISDEAFQEVVNNAKLNWLPSFVDTYEDIATMYPNPEEGDTTMARHDSADYPTDPNDKREAGTVWRFDGTEWQPIQQIDISDFNREFDELNQRMDDFQTDLTAEVDKTFNVRDASSLTSINDTNLKAGTYRIDSTLTTDNPDLKAELPQFDNDTGNLIVMPTIDQTAANQRWISITTGSIYERMSINATDFGEWMRMDNYQRIELTTGTDILTLPPGRYYLANPVNGPVENSSAWYNVDITKYSNNEHRQFLVTRNFDGFVWYGTIHTNNQFKGWQRLDNQPKWKNLTLINGWTTFGGRPPQYSKIGNFVYLRGALSSGVKNEPFAILPDEATPPMPIIASSLSVGSGSSSAPINRLTVYNNGEITISFDFGPEDMGWGIDSVVYSVE
ncbi:hypothetical protein [Virgibacillus sp. Bac332]|uniref:hypothetical protein n=1 Tax=Virgibacillus sp. Bac332 TaxID=2419842 RepID=UPI000EF47D20|nr:hypothetical protein [Virgibacillus sp. Bac332]